MAIREHRRTFGNHRLLAIGYRHVAGPSTGLPAPLEVLEYGLVEPHRAPKNGRDTWFGQIVGCGTKSTRGDHGSGAVERLANGGRDVVGSITTGGATDNRHADGRELAR